MSHLNDISLPRNHFEKHALIFVPSTASWYPPSSCLWTENTHIPGKAALREAYKDLYQFFIETLEVSTPDLGMFVESLIELCNGHIDPPFQRVRELLHDINSWRPSHEALEGLRSCNICPVRGPNGELMLRNPRQSFAIIDRVQYGDLFLNKIPILDLKFEEAHELRPLLIALSLEERYISNLVTETSIVDDCELDLQHTWLMRCKAHAIFR